MKILKIVILMIITIIILSNCKKNSKNYYRAGIILKDSISLENGITLSKGAIVQILNNKSTEEGTFIKIKNDSAKIYWKYIKTLCWLRRDIEIPEIGSNKKHQLSNKNFLILEGINNDDYIVSFQGKKFKISQQDIYFDNKQFFDSLIDKNK